MFYRVERFGFKGRPKLEDRSWKTEEAMQVYLCEDRYQSIASER